MNTLGPVRPFEIYVPPFSGSELTGYYVYDRIQGTLGPFETLYETAAVVSSLSIVEQPEVV